MIGISVAISSHLVARCSEPTAETTGQEKVLWPLGTFGAGVQLDFLLAYRCFLHTTVYAKKPKYYVLFSRKYL